MKKSSTKTSSIFLLFRWAGYFNFPHPPYSMVKIIKKILRFLFFEISWKINRKFTFFKTKLTITWKIKIGKIWFLFFLFRRFCIFHLNLTTFEIKIHKWSNLHGRSGIGWIERKNQISDFSDFYFSSYAEKNSKTGNSLNAVEREPIPTRVLNLNASETSYKPKQRSNRKTKLNFFFLLFFGGILSANPLIHLPCPHLMRKKLSF